MANERLYQFPSKASPTPADIIFCGNAADAFNEVNITIAALIAAYPNLFAIGNLTLGANTYIYSNNSSVIGTGTITALGVSLLSGATVAAMQTTLGYTATATASLFAGWDANKNLSANNLIPGYATTVTAAGTTTLTVASAGQQYFTGSSNQTIVMPVASTVVLGQYWTFVNLSTGTLTIQSSGANTITTIGANSSATVTCILASGTTAASWSAETPVAGAGVVNSGTINNLAYYAATGSAVSALGTANNGVLVTSNTGVPSILAGPGSAGLTLLSQAAAAPIWSTGKPITRVIVQTFTATGAGTYTPTSGMTYCVVKAVGPGGGTGGATGASGQGDVSSGAGAGGYAEQVFTAATIGASQAVFIGTGGTAGTATGNGGNGSAATTFGALLTANPGAGTIRNGSIAVTTGSPGGAGGTATGGYLNITGSTGGSCFYFPAGVGVVAGVGGASPLGFGGGGSFINSSQAGIAPTGFGAGAGGAGSCNGTGGVVGAAGGNGFIEVTEYISI